MTENQSGALGRAVSWWRGFLRRPFVEDRRQAFVSFLRTAGLLVALGLIQVVLRLAFRPVADTEPPVIEQGGELLELNLPGWAEPFAPLVTLPLWVQAVLAAAVVGALFYLVPAIGQWVYGLFSDRTEERD